MKHKTQSLLKHVLNALMKLGPSSAIKYTYFASKLVQINSSFTKSPSEPLRLYTGYRFDQSMSEFIAIF